MNYRDQLKNAVKKIVREVIEEKTTHVNETWADMIESLSKEIKKPITLDDAGNYNVCECEPHHINIRPIVHDIFDLQYFKDGVERQKILYIPFADVKKYVKQWLGSKELNYVDNAYEKNVENSKDKEGGKKADKSAEEQNLVDPEKDNKVIKSIKAKSMNDPKDDPTEPMRPIGKTEKQVDYKSKKPSYEPPKLPKNLQKLVVKYTKGGKTRKK
tara:strand:- start:5319 stop:5960 length:642 start_codon:yes stop_codon:yes gene_type:complete